MQKATQLNITKSRFSLIKYYISTHKLLFGLSAYYVFSIILKIVFSIDILIPCLWKTLFHFECPGCGLTTALIKVLLFDFDGAWQANPLIYIVLPLGIFLFARDYSNFKSQISNNKIQTNIKSQFKKL